MTQQLTDAERAELESLRAERDAKANRELTFKVSPKTGIISVYGLGKFPLNAYMSQWEKFFKAVPALQAFIASLPSDSPARMTKAQKLALAEATKNEAKA